MSKETKNRGSSTSSPVVLPVVNPNAAGIDVSARMHVVAIPPGREVESVRTFGAYTEDLHALAKWLSACSITTVAMESTGVYWKQLFMVLSEYGFKVSLVNARHVKNVTGRKTDMDDAQWIQKLHSCGLLNSCFLPDDITESLRSLVRHRKSLVRDSSKYVLRMEKALEMMNIKIQGVISDITGKTGTGIINAILSGERDPEQFLQYVDPRIKAGRQEIKKSLTGNWRKEQLFLLQENFTLYKLVSGRIAACEKEIDTYLQIHAASINEGVIQENPSNPVPQKPVKNGRSKNDPGPNVQNYLKQIHQVDVTKIYGISNGSALEIYAETGADLSKWESENHFVSWLNLCPNNKITGGKLISSKVLKKKAGNATQAFRAAANTLQRSSHWLGDYFRRMKSKGGNKYAIIATARKLAIIYYKMVRNKQEFNPMNTDDYLQRYRSAKIAYFEKQLIKLRATG